MNDFDYNQNIHFLNSYCDFSNPNNVWIMKGISRNKDNSNNPEMEKFFRRMVITCPDDIVTSYREIHLLANDPLTTYRIYISLNSRDVMKAIINFQKLLIDVSHGVSTGNTDVNRVKLLGSAWKTELEQSSCRGTKRILFDIDDLDSEPDYVVEFLNNNCKTKVHCMRRTVSGWAIVFDACDTRELMRLCEEEWKIKVDLQRDSMLFVEAFQPFC